MFGPRSTNCPPSFPPRLIPPRDRWYASLRFCCSASCCGICRGAAFGCCAHGWLGFAFTVLVVIVASALTSGIESWIDGSSPRFFATSNNDSYEYRLAIVPRSAVRSCVTLVSFKFDGGHEMHVRTDRDKTWGDCQIFFGRT